MQENAQPRTRQRFWKHAVIRDRKNTTMALSPLSPAQLVQNPEIRKHARQPTSRMRENRSLLRHRLVNTTVCLADPQYAAG